MERAVGDAHTRAPPAIRRERLLRLAAAWWRIDLRRRPALLALQLLAGFVGAPLQLFLQLLLLLLEDFRIGRRTLISLGEIVQRHHQTDRLARRTRGPGYEGPPP